MSLPDKTRFNLTGHWIKIMNEYDKMEVKRKRSPEEALDELQREFNVRARCFGRWVAEGRVSKTDAQDRLDRLGTAIELLTPDVSNPTT